MPAAQVISTAQTNARIVVVARWTCRCQRSRRRISRARDEGAYTYGTQRGSTGELLFQTLHIFGGILKMAGQAGWRREGRAATQSSAIIDEAARVVRGRGSATWGRSGAGRGGTHSYYKDWPFDWR